MCCLTSRPPNCVACYSLINRIHSLHCINSLCNSPIIGLVCNCNCWVSCFSSERVTTWMELLIVISSDLFPLCKDKSMCKRECQKSARPEIYIEHRSPWVLCRIPRIWRLAIIVDSCQIKLDCNVGMAWVPKLLVKHLHG